jgi:hypothetical protein
MAGGAPVYSGAKGAVACLAVVCTALPNVWNLRPSHWIFVWQAKDIQQTRRLFGDDKWRSARSVFVQRLRYAGSPREGSSPGENILFGPHPVGGGRAKNLWSYGTGVLHLIQINRQPNATIFQFINLTFVYSSTCFGRFPAHHQELLMMGGKTPETRWAVNKRQDNKLKNCCISLVIYLNCMMMHGPTNLKIYI